MVKTDGIDSNGPNCLMTIVCGHSLRTPLIARYGSDCGRCNRSIKEAGNRCFGMAWTSLHEAESLGSSGHVQMNLRLWTVARNLGGHKRRYERMHEVFIFRDPTQTSMGGRLAFSAFRQTAVENRRPTNPRTSVDSVPGRCSVR